MATAPQGQGKGDLLLPEGSIPEEQITEQDVLPVRGGKNGNDRAGESIRSSSSSRTE